MKRKKYTSGYERKYDQRIGALAFLIVNVVVWLLVTWAQAWLRTAQLDAATAARLGSTVQLLPWVVNGGLLIWAFVFRPHIGIGYITAFGAILTAGIMLGGLAVVSCFISLPFFFFGEPLGLIVLGVLAIAGFGWFVKTLFETVITWWSDYEDTSQEQER